MNEQVILTQNRVEAFEDSAKAGKPTEGLWEELETLNCKKRSFLPLPWPLISVTVESDFQGCSRITLGSSTSEVFDMTHEAAKLAAESLLREAAESVQVSDIHEWNDRFLYTSDEYEAAEMIADEYLREDSEDMEVLIYRSVSLPERKYRVTKTTEAHSGSVPALHRSYLPYGSVHSPGIPCYYHIVRVD